MTVWKDQKISATIREFEDDGVDSANGSFQALAMKDEIQAVRDGVHDRDSLGEDNEGTSGGKPHK
jgi:hypothetical protein